MRVNEWNELKKDIAEIKTNVAVVREKIESDRREIAIHRWLIGILVLTIISLPVVVFNVVDRQISKTINVNTRRK